jgi:hypothetical protein
MCQLKSVIILKDRVFVPDYDSHTNMLEELKIKDTGENAEKLFVRAELIPKDDDMFSPIEEWRFKVDQDIIPEWFVEEHEKSRVVSAVTEWAKEHIHIGISNLGVYAGTHYLKNCREAKAYGNSTVEVCDNSTVEGYGNSTVEACGNSTVEAYGNNTVKACDISTVKAYGNSTVKAYSNSTIEAYSNSTIEAYDNSTVKAHNNSTIEACDISTVKAYDNSTVKAEDNSTIEAYGNSIVVLGDFSESDRENIVLNENSTLKDLKTKTIYQSGDWKIKVV